MGLSVIAEETKQGISVQAVVTAVQSVRENATDSVADTHCCALQAELAAELDGKKGSLEVLSGRWWRKRWSRHKAEAAMEQLLRLLQVGEPLQASH